MDKPNPGQVVSQLRELPEKLRRTPVHLGEHIRILNNAADAIAELEQYKAQYHELVLAVESVFPGESRHATALRYIRRAETRHQGDVAQTDSGG